MCPNLRLHYAEKRRFHFFQCPTCTLYLLGANMNQQYRDIKYGLNVENKLLLFFEVLSDLMYFQC